MKERFAALSPRTVLILAAVGVLLYAAVAWLLFVTPKRSETARLGEDVAVAQVQLVQARAAARRPARTGAPVSDVFRLTKAMPSSGEQPGLVLELTRLATSTGVDLRSISLQPALEGAGGATMVPVVVVLGGTYRKVTAYLARTRSLVTVRHGRLRTKGRLFTVQSVELAESLAGGFPKLDATVTLNAYVYDGPIVIVPEEAPSTEESDGAAAAGGTG